MLTVLKVLFCCAMAIVAVIFAAYFRLDVLVSSPMTHHLLNKPDVAYLKKQGRELDYDLMPRFFKEGASKTKVLSKLSREGYSFRSETSGGTYRRETAYGIGHCITVITVKFKADNTLASSRGTRATCIL